MIGISSFYVFDINADITGVFCYKDGVLWFETMSLFICIGLLLALL